MNLQQLVSKVYSYQRISSIAKSLPAVAELNPYEILAWLLRWERSRMFSHQLQQTPGTNLTCQVITDNGMWHRVAQWVEFCDVMGGCDTNSSLACFPAWDAKPVTSFMLYMPVMQLHLIWTHVNHAVRRVLLPTLLPSLNKGCLKRIVITRVALLLTCQISRMLWRSFRN